MGGISLITAGYLRISPVGDHRSYHQGISPRHARHYIRESGSKQADLHDLIAAAPRSLSMRDLLIGLAFVAMVFSPAIVASFSKNKSDDEA